MASFDSRRTLTKRKILQALENYPLDEPIMVNVEFQDGENWDTWYAYFCDLSYLCPGMSGCTHTEPEWDWEMVLGVKFGEARGIMEPDFENKDSTC
jgi:hypothetical protein